MKTEDLIGMHHNICGRAREIMLAKNHDYSHGEDALANFKACEMFGVPHEVGLMIRMTDKFKRIETFVKAGELKVDGEPWNDAILDLINYTILLAGLLHERSEGRVGSRGPVSREQMQAVQDDEATEQLRAMGEIG